MNGELVRNKPVPAFIGVSSIDGGEGAYDEEPSLASAIDRAAQLAHADGHAGELFHLTVEIVPNEHNQWVRTYRAIITGA
jgi:hypothetical protein